MNLVYICSPLRGDIASNQRKAIAYCEFASKQGVIPLAPHTIFTQYLNDEVPEQREQGLKMGLELLRKCDQLWVCGDEISEGMQAEISLATELSIPVVSIEESYISLQNESESKPTNEVNAYTEDVQDVDSNFQDEPNHEDEMTAEELFQALAEDADEVTIEPVVQSKSSANLNKLIYDSNDGIDSLDRVANSIRR